MMKIGLLLTSVQFHSHLANRSAFKYYMKGLNNKWTETDQRTVEFGSLEPGNYTFIVLAIDKNGNQSLKPSEFSFSVSPPFWKRIGFQIVAISSGIILLVIGMRG
jgi:hypothetical protein